MLRILRRTRQRTKKPKDQLKRRRRHQGQARDHCDPAKQRTIPSGDHQESSSAPTESEGFEINSSCRGDLKDIPSSIELVDNCFYFKGIKVRFKE